MLAPSAEPGIPSGGPALEMDLGSRSTFTAFGCLEDCSCVTARSG